MADSGHISDDDLERYLLNMVTEEDELARLDEHLLVRGQCIDRAENTEGDVGAMRTALRRLRTKRKGA